MNSCPWREQLLELDVNELDANELDVHERDVHELQSAEWQAHFDACSDCSDAAQQILAAYDGLDRVLGAAPPVDTAAILARARMTASAPVRSGRRVQRLVLLAAAASIAGLLMLREWERPLPGTPSVPSVQAPVEWALEGDRDVAVLPTDHPDITVLWFFSGD